MSKSSEAVKEWRKRTKERMILAMGGKCAICSYDRCNSALEFHHLDPREKELGFGDLRASPKAWRTIVQELRKCVLLCCRCHREVHDGAVGVPDDYPRFNDIYEDYKALERGLTRDACPVCGVEKPIHNRTCSKACAGRNRGKVKWEDFDVVALVEASSFRSVAILLDVSPGAVKKRYDKIKSMI